ncbi:uncharacterized protein LOC115452931 isoform X2 [Manduca sexta]|nr:uncharacterized protein LOC115452931 isoform X2 [Manduca sexta]KAG6464249.1 hypothetical protein O3G_MSEX014385 [Manduca sexta]
MQMLKFFTNSLAGWPIEAVEGIDGKKNFYWRNGLVVIAYAYFFGQVFYIYRYINDYTFLVMGHSYITVLMTIVTIARHTLPYFKCYDDTTADFVHNIHLFNYRNKPGYYKEFHLKIHKISHAFSVYLCTLLVTGPSMFNGIPLYNNYASGAFSFNRSPNVTYEQAVSLLLPFDDTNNFKGYFVVFLANCCVSYISSCCLCIYDLLLSLMVFHLWGHLKILTKTLDNFPKPGFLNPQAIEADPNKSLKFSDEELKVIHKKLGECVAHHQLISNFSTRMSNTFGLSLFIYYGFHQLSGCLLLLECAQLEAAAIICYGPLTLVVFQQLIQLSFIFELIGTVNEGLTDSVYCLPWEAMDQGNKKIVFTFLRQSQKSMNLKALNMLSIGVQTMAKILKTTMTYFLMLQTIAKDES